MWASDDLFLRYGSLYIEGFFLSERDGSRRDSNDADGPRSSVNGADGHFFRARLGERRTKLPGISTSEVNNKDVNDFVPVKTASFLWGQRSSVPLSPAKGFSG
jgi:hypothetical protein